MTDIVEKLRLIAKPTLAADKFESAVLTEAADEIERLRQVCRDAYEVWAGSEGIPEPETAAEAYLLQLLLQMRDEVKRGL